MKRIQLSKNFWLDEFTRSETAIRLGRPIIVAANDDIVENLKALCANVLQPLRDDVRRSIHITSGYRPPWLNRMIGGSPRSQHRFGRAVDFVVASRTPISACQRILDLDLPFDQLIHEFSAWTHVSYIGKDNRSVVLTAVKGASGKTEYSSSLALT